MSCSLGHQVFQVTPKAQTLSFPVAQIPLWKQHPCQAESCSRASPGSASPAATALRHNPKLPFCSFRLISTPICTAQITASSRSSPRLSLVTLGTGTASPTRLLWAAEGTGRCHRAKSNFPALFQSLSLTDQAPRPEHNAIPRTARGPEPVRGPVLLSLSLLKFLLESLRNLGCGFVLWGASHTLCFQIKAVTSAASSAFWVRAMPQRDSGCQAVPERGTAGRQERETGNRHGKKGDRGGTGQCSQEVPC